MANGDQTDLSAGFVKQTPGGVDLSAGFQKPAAPAAPATPPAAPAQTYDPRNPQSWIQQAKSVQAEGAARWQAGQALTFGEAGTQLAMGGAEFIRDILDPRVPIAEGPHALLKKYVTDPMDEQIAAAEASGTAGSYLGVLGHSAAAAVPFAGPMAASTFEQFHRAHTMSEYAGVGLFGLATYFAAKGLKEGGEMTRRPGDPGLVDVGQALTERQKIVEGTH